MKSKYLHILFAMLVLSADMVAAQPDSLSDYLRIAATNNPLLKSQFLTYKAGLEKIPQAGAIPDPQLEMGFFLTPMEVLDGKQVADFKLMQMFPWFGTRKAARNEASEMARMSYEQFRETRDNLFFELKSTWYNLLNLNRQLANIEENKALLTVLKDLALVRFSAPSVSTSGGGTSLRSSGAGMQSSTTPSSGGMGAMGAASGTATVPRPTPMNAMPAGGGMGSSMKTSQGGMSDVLRIQLEFNELEDQEQAVISQVITAKAKFNTLLGRDPDHELVLPDTISQVDFQWDDHHIMRTIIAQNPMLLMATAEEAAYRAKEVMDKRMGFPMIGIGLQYSLIDKREGGMIPVTHMNGKDMLMPMVSLSIPIWRKKYKGAQNESRLMARAAKEKYQDALNNLSSTQRSVRQQLLDAERKVKLYTGQEELADMTYELAVKEFVTGAGNLTNVLDVERQLLDYKFKKSEAIATYNTVVAMVENLLSEPQE